MELEIIKYLSVGGTPVSIILVGILFYRWTSSKYASFSDDLTEIKQALNCKVSKELYISERKDTDRRIERLEKHANGNLK